MNRIVDSLNNVSGWDTFNSILQLVTLEKPINSEEQCFKVTFEDEGYIEKDFSEPVDLSYSDTIVLTIPYFRNDTDIEIVFADSQGYTKLYSCKLKKTKSYYLFYREDLHDIVHIRINCINNILLLSNIIAFKDELPYDIGIGLKNLIESYTETVTFELGVGNTNNNGLRIDGQSKLIERYSVITFNNEKHQIESYKQFPNYYEVLFTQLYDGRQPKQQIQNTNVNLMIPVLSFPKDIEMNNPSIVINGNYQVSVNGYVAIDQEDIQHIDESYINYALDRLGNYKYQLVIHCIYRYSEVKQKLLTVLHKLVGTNKVIYINGRRYPVMFENIIENELENETGELQVNANIIIEVNEWRLLKNLSQVQVSVNIL